MRFATRRLNKEIEKSIARHAKMQPKKFWSYIRKKSKTRAGIPDLTRLGANGMTETATTDEEKANMLSDHFASVFTMEPDGPSPKFTSQAKSSITNMNITEDTVLKKLKKLKTDKSPGPDGLHPRVLKEVAASIA